jgi:hypothetical protein
MLLRPWSLVAGLYPPPLTLPSLDLLPGHAVKQEGHALPLMGPQPLDQHVVDRDGIPSGALGGSPQHQGLNTFWKGLVRRRLLKECRKMEAVREGWGRSFRPLSIPLPTAP